MYLQLTDLLDSIDLGLVCCLVVFCWLLLDWLFGFGFGFGLVDVLVFVRHEYLVRVVCLCCGGLIAACDCSLGFVCYGCWTVHHLCMLGGCVLGLC